MVLSATAGAGEIDNASSRRVGVGDVTLGGGGVSGCRTMGERGGVGCEARRGRDDVDSLNTGVSVSDCRADKSKSSLDELDIL